MFSFLKRSGYPFLGFAIALFFVGVLSVKPAAAAVCVINAETVPPAIDQAYVDANSCSSIQIADSVSTTWVGTVDMGGGTVTVLSGNTMTMGSSSVMTLGLNDDFVVQANATTTQTIGDPTGVQINARNIQISGAVHASELGCSGGLYAAGSGPNGMTGICELSGTGAGTQNTGGPYGGSGQGGAYGGRGGALNTRTFGDSLDPTFLGAGGGGDNFWAISGGSGGGRIQIHASGLLSIDGGIYANGGVGSSYSWDMAGGGSGGSISLEANFFSGTGFVQANGGDGSGGSGGGGGRIKVLYNTLGTFDLSHISANGGAPLSAAEASARNGTVYILDRVVDDGAGTLTLNSGFDFPVSGDYVRDAVHFGNGGYFSCPTSTNITISSSAEMSLENVTWECRNPVDVFSLLKCRHFNDEYNAYVFGGF
jgi:hypothetical protein